jgi:hypothetical protein
MIRYMTNEEIHEMKELEMKVQNDRPMLMMPLEDLFPAIEVYRKYADQVDQPAIMTLNINGRVESYRLQHPGLAIIETLLYFHEGANNAIDEHEKRYDKMSKNYAELKEKYKTVQKKLKKYAAA